MTQDWRLADGCSGRAVPCVTCHTPPLRGRTKKAHRALPAVPEIAHVRYECLRLQVGSVRIGSVCTCVFGVRLLDNRDGGILEYL